MFDVFINITFLMVWLAMFYGMLHAFHRFIPKGFFIAQLVFLYGWLAMPYYRMHYIGFLSYDTIPVFWMVASLLFLFSLQKKD